MSFAKLPLDFAVSPDQVLAGQVSLLVLYRDQLCPTEAPPPAPRVIRVLDHGDRPIAQGTWTVAGFGDQNLEWRAFVVTFSGGTLLQRQGEDAGVRLFAAFFEQTTISIELCIAGHAQCPDDCTRRDNLILKLGVRPA